MDWLLWLMGVLGFGAVIFAGYLLGSFRKAEEAHLERLTAKKQSEVAHDFKHTAEIYSLPRGSKRDIIDSLREPE